MAGKKESTFLSMTLTLFIVSLVASAALGFIYELTKGTIEEADKKATVEAISEVLVNVEYNNDLATDTLTLIADDGSQLMCYFARNNEEITGAAIRTFTDKGFSGRFYLMVGFKKDGTINNIVVLEHKETPGLGDKMDKKKSEWSNQFIDKDPNEFHISVKKDGGDVDAITAATISSRAYCDAVNKAYNAFMNYINENYE